jgi:integrase
MPSQKLTDSFIRNFSTDKSRVEISDELKPGLVLRVSKKGNKTFVYRYRVHGTSKRYTIGKYPIISLSKARTLADELYLQAKQEKDPQKEKMLSRRREIITIKDLADTYKKRHLPTLKKSTREDYKRRIDNFIVSEIGDIEINELSRINIIEFLEEIAEDAPIQSNRVRAILSSMYSFGMKKALCEFNPVSTVKPLGEENTRDRVYSEKEIAELWKAFELENTPFQQVFKMLLITGQRLGETRRMKWTDINNDTWIIPEEETKAKRTHYVPLSEFALELLEEMKEINGDSDYVFQSTAKVNEPIGWLQHSAVRVSKASKVTDFRIHDLRRTSASFMAKMGVNRTVLGKVLNHKGLAGDSKVTAVYDRHDYMNEKRVALENWTIHLKGIINGAETKANVYKIGS